MPQHPEKKKLRKVERDKKLAERKRKAQALLGLFGGMLGKTERRMNRPKGSKE